MKVAITALLIFGLGACEQGDGVAVSKAEFHPPLGSTGIGAAYFSIQSNKKDRIVAVSSSEADKIEIHASVIEGSSVHMEQRKAVDLPAGQAIAFAPGGMHLMVFAPHENEAETTFPITIELESGLKKTVPFHKFRAGAEPAG